MKKLLVLVLIITSAASIAQTDTLAYYHFQQLFVEELSDSTFKQHYDTFYQNAYKNIDSSNQWHRGQTDYSETFYSSGFHQFNSVTYFNSLTTTLFVQQLCYDYKVVFVTQAGGEPMEVYGEDRIFELPYKGQFHQTPNDTIYSPITLYNHELGKKLSFETISVYKRSAPTMEVPDGMITGSKYVGIRNRQIENVSKDQLPKIFIENH